MIDHYDWAGGREAMLRFGPADGPVVVMLPALFEEHNRTRAFAVTICRGLADHGVASLLPDLPGQGESVVPTEDAMLDHWQMALQGLLAAQSPASRVILASIRGGAVVNSATGLSGVWRLSPVTGQAVLRDLMRTRAVAGDYVGGLDYHPVEAAGNVIGRAMINALEAADDVPIPSAPLRTVRLDSDPASADMKLPGAPIWRRTEPGNDPALAALLAADLADWVRQCVA
ncbi:hypothetical protein [Sphingomonas sp. 28-62-11]|uniref:hypothetical protein n=1 Tax=Sphingomonas sp. 28-62-11 TaxID=1970432 RepID=UPI000BCFC935|nr:MAG: hypothetical protein B7Y49_03225 [Sphingomonas sp. 28-62-11]